MMNVGELVAYLSLDQSRYDRGLDSAEAKGKDFAGTTFRSKADVDTSLAQSKLGALSALARDNAAEIAGVGQKMTMGVTLPVLAGLGFAVKEASDLSESANKVNVVFGEQADGVQKWAQAAAVAMGQSKQEALENASTFGNLFVSLGMTSSESAKMSMSLTQLAGDFASFNNVSPTEAFEALRAGLVGETEPLRRFGVNMDDATLKAKAMSMGLEWQGQVLPPLVKAQAAYALILEQSTTAQGDFARTSDGLANSMRIGFAELKDAAAEFGAKAVPLVTPVLHVFTDILKVVGDLPGPVKGALLVLGTAASVIGPGLWALGSMAEGIKTLQGAFRAVKTALTTADTLAIEANTAAVEANTIARGQNASAPPVGSTGTAPPLGAPGTQMVANGKWAGWGQLAFLGGLGAAGIGATMGTIELTPDEIRQLEERLPLYQKMRDEYEKIVAQIKQISPSTPQAEQKLAELTKQLAELRKQSKATGKDTPQIAKDIDATLDKIQDRMKVFSKATKQMATESVESLDQVKESIVGSAKSIYEAIAGATAAGLRLSNDEINALMEKLGPPKIKNFVPLPNADNKPLPWPPKAAARGIDYTTSGPELLLVGDNPSGRERVTVTPDAQEQRGSAKSQKAGDTHVHLHIQNLHGTDRAAAERFANQVGDILARRVRYACG